MYVVLFSIIIYCMQLTENYLNVVDNLAMADLETLQESNREAKTSAKYYAVLYCSITCYFCVIGCYQQLIM